MGIKTTNTKTPEINEINTTDLVETTLVEYNNDYFRIIKLQKLRLIRNIGIINFRPTTAEYLYVQEKTYNLQITINYYCRRYSTTEEL